ncbi:MAG: adventurous gliding motility lipoprotein CglB [Myxococcaceae bacterium]
MKRFAIAAAVAGAILTAVGCAATKPCASTCSGCCDAADKCEAGNQPTACGFAGAICHQCLLGQSCLGGTCISTSGASGGGSAVGGGSGAGGGGGGGMSAGGGSATGGGGQGGGGGGGGTSTGGGAAVGGGGGTMGAGGGTTTPMPNVMFVIDKSGSMLEPMNPNDPNCPSGCGAGAACPAACVTRWGAVSNGLGNFLGSSFTGQTARWGAEFFPADTVCTAASLTTITDGGVDLPTDPNDTPSLLQTQANAVIAAITKVVPGGGTPTAASLNVLATYPQLGDPNRHEWVVLLTDGVPNCNPNNPNTCNDPNACQCTVLSGQCTSANGYCQLGCVDVDGTAMSEIALQQHGIKTIVVGVGTDVLSGNGPTTMQTMGQAGGYVRTCPFGTNTECLPGTCNTSTKVCSAPYFTVGSQTEVEQVLQTIAGTF